MPFYKISKLEAARRQLETALKLFFNDSDSISIHTLTAAAHNVLKDLAQKEKGEDKKVIMDDKVLELVKEEMKETFTKKMREPQNFFKHADRDAESELRFNPQINDMHLFDAVWLYHQFTDNLPFWIKSYKIWFMMNNTEIFNGLEEPYASQLAEISQEDFARNKADFIKLMKGVERRYIT